MRNRSLISPVVFAIIAPLTLGAMLPGLAAEEKPLRVLVTYGNFYVAPDAHVLMTTDHPKCGRDIAWTKQHGKSRVCYLIFGHDSKAWQNPAYQDVLGRAIRWAAP